MCCVRTVGGSSMSPTRGSGARLSRTVSTHFRRRLAVTDCPYSPRGKTTRRSCRVGHRRRATARLHVSPRTAAAQARAARWPTKWRNSRTSRIWVRLRCSLAHLLALCSSCVYVCANRNLLLCCVMSAVCCLLSAALLSAALCTYTYTCICWNRHVRSIAPPLAYILWIV